MGLEFRVLLQVCRSWAIETASRPSVRAVGPAAAAAAELSVQAATCACRLVGTGAADLLVVSSPKPLRPVACCPLRRSASLPCAADCCAAFGVGPLFPWPRTAETDFS